MNTIKTKETSELLGVSQTTVKRWASYFSPSFQKDRFGHYVFSDHEISLLRHIKDQIEQGNALDCISLPVNRIAEPAWKLGNENLDDNELLSRIREVERSLYQKADEVVSVQVLQHRAELDELRQMIAQLAASVENMQRPRVKPLWPHEDFRVSVADKAAIPPRKRGFFRSFF